MWIGYCKKHVTWKLKRTMKNKLNMCATSRWKNCYYLTVPYSEERICRALLKYSFSAHHCGICLLFNWSMCSMYFGECCLTENFHCNCFQTTYWDRIKPCILPSISTSHPEIFGFQDVIKIKKINNFLIILKFFQHLFSSQGI